MNMKSLLKELVKDPQIKALYNEGFDRSIVNRLIIESLMEEETPKPPTQKEINAINDIKVLDQLVQKFSNVDPDKLRPTDKHNLQDLSKRVRKRKRELQQQKPKATSSSEPQQQPDASGDLNIISKGHSVFGRPFVIVKTSKGNVAFYKSTGKGSAAISKAGDWQPFGGVSATPRQIFWIIKGQGEDFEWTNEAGTKITSKVPNPESELGKISSSLKALNENKGELEKVKQLIYNYLNFKQPNELREEEIEELADAIVTNRILKKYDALNRYGNPENNVKLHGIDPINPGIIAFNVIKKRFYVNKDQHAVKKRGPFTYENLVKLANEEASSDSEKGGEEGLAKFSPEIIDAINKESTPKEVKAVAQNLAQNIKKSKDINDEQKKEAVKNIYQLAQDKITELTQGKTKDNLSLEDYKKIIESDELQQIKKVFDAIKQAFEENPGAASTKDLNLEEIRTATNLNENNAAELITYLSRMIAFLKAVMEGSLAFSREGFYELYKKLFDFEETVVELLPLVANSPKKETKALAIMNKKANELEAISQKVLPAPKEDDKTGELATIGVQPPTDDTGEKPQTPEDEKKKVPEYIARESFLENWGPVGIAFDNYEDRFDQTPFLDEQAQVLFALRDALKDFDSGLRKAAKPTGKREEAPEQVQEQAGEVIQVQPQEQKKIFKLHKELIRETKELVKIIKQLNDENIYTIGGGKIQKQARLKAKKLMNLMKLAFDELEAIKGEEKEKLTFKEQQEMDKETELLRKSHQQILSNMTKMDRIARARPGKEKDTRIESKYIVPVVEKTIKIIEDIEHMFPVSSPFGKKGNLGEIKIQVKGISRDIIDIVAKLKDFATSSKTRSENVDKLKEYIVNAMATISNSFDIDIEDEELKSLLPKKARPNAASYNDGAADLKDKIDNFINKKGPVIAKQLKKKTLSSFMKVKEFITKNLKKEFGNKVPVIMVAKQLPEVEAEYIDEMEVITRFVDFMVRMLDENEKITFKESLRNFLKQFNFKDRSKLGKQLVKEFTREEIREIKDYLSKKNQLQDLVAVVKQQQKLSYEKIPTYQGNMDDIIGIDPKDAGFEDDDELKDDEPKTSDNEDEKEKPEEKSDFEDTDQDVVQQFEDQYVERVSKIRDFISDNGKVKVKKVKVDPYKEMTFLAHASKLNGRFEKISKDLAGDGLENPELQLDRFEEYISNLEKNLKQYGFGSQTTDNDLSPFESKFINSLDEKYKPVFEKVINYINDQKQQGLMEQATVEQQLLTELGLKELYNKLKEDNVLNKDERLLFIDALKSSERIRRDFNTVIEGFIDFDEVEREVKKLLNIEPEEKPSSEKEKGDPDVSIFSDAVEKEVKQLDKDDIEDTSQKEIIQQIKDEPEVQEPLKDLNLSSDQVDEIIEDEIETYFNDDEEQESEPSTELDSILQEIEEKFKGTSDDWHLQVIEDYRKSKEVNLGTKLRKHLGKLAFDGFSVLENEILDSYEDGYYDEEIVETNLPKIKKIQQEFKKFNETFKEKAELIIPPLWDEEYLVIDNEDEVETVSAKQMSWSFKNQITAIFIPGIKSLDDSFETIKAKVKTAV